MPILAKLWQSDAKIRHYYSVGGLKLSRKVLFIVAVPVIAELALVGCLLFQLDRVDKARVEESYSRELLSHINSALSANMQRSNLLIWASVRHNKGTTERQQALAQRIRREVLTIKELALQGKGADRETWQRIADLMNRIHMAFDGAKKDYDSGNKMAAAVAWGDIQQDIDELIEIADRIARKNELLDHDQQTRIERDNQVLRGMLYGSVLLSIITAFGLVFVFNRSTTDRLKVIMVNTERMSVGKAPVGRLGGNDELAQIYRVFHRMYQELQNLRRKEMAILENIADIVCSLDKQLIFSSINEAVCNMWRYDQDAVIGRRAVDLFDPAERGEIRAKLLETIDEKGSKRFDAKVIRQDGTICETAWSATWSEEEQALYCVVQDIGSRKQLEQMKRDFVAVVSHDLRTPLTAIQMIHSMLKEDGEGLLPPHAMKNLNSAQDNVSRLMALINNLLDLEKLDAGFVELIMEQVPLSPAIERATGAIEAIAKKQKIALANLLDSNQEAYIDSERITQVVVNLLSNALKFSPANSTISISAVNLPDKFIKVLITDQGRGIPADKIASVFERFSQVRSEDGRANKGSGLGLAICKAIIEQHGGEIGVESVEGKGSTFWFTLASHKNYYAAKLAET
jgi:PAS domain S-box-containing protein